jgi:hypothetical protein
VVEEFKGPKPEWYEASDSEDERDKKDMEEQQQESAAFAFTEEGTKALAELEGAATTLILCTGITSQTFARINFSDAWKSIAVGQVKDAKKDKYDKKCECFLLADRKSAFLFLLPDREGVKAIATNQMTKSLLAQVKQVSQVVVLREIYKTAYTGPEDPSPLQEGRLRLVTHQTSHLTPAQAEWLLAKIGNPAHFTVAAGGMGAALLTHCEMFGLPAFAVTAITDSHYVSGESMQCYSDVFAQFGLDSGDFNSKQISKKPKFKEILKEANQRGHSIFS